MPQAPHPQAELSFSTLIAHFSAALTHSSDTERELRSKRAILTRHLEPALARLTLAELSSGALEDYKARKRAEGLSPKTINNHLSVLRSVLRAAKTAGLVAAVPSVENMAIEPGGTDFLKPEAATRLLRAAKGEQHAMILLALRAGLRLGELRGLRWTDVDLAGGTLRVRAEGSAASRHSAARDVPLSARTAAVLQALPRRSPFVFASADGSQLSHGACKWPLYRAARRAGLPPIGWQVLRNTFTRELVTRNVSVRAVQNLLGCRSSAPILRYLPAAEDSERAAILLLDVRDGGSTSARATRWRVPRAAAERDLSFFVFVPNYGRERARLGAPYLGRLSVPVLSPMAGLEPTH